MTRSGFGRLPSVLAAMVGVALTMAAFYGLARYERQQVEYQFDRDASNRVQAVHHALVRSCRAVESLAALYAASFEVDPDEFHRFVRPLLAREPGLRAMAWLPLVSAAQRTRFVPEAQKLIPGYRITQRSTGGKLVPEGQRPFYLPILYEAPLKGNRKALGFDIASEPRRLAAAERARDSGRPAATTRIHLVQDAGNNYTFAVFVPVYRNGATPQSVAGRRAALSGLVAGIYRTGAIVENSLSFLEPVGIDLKLYQSARAEPDTLLYQHRGRRPSSASVELDDPDPPWLRKVAHFSMAGLPWTLVLEPEPDAYPMHVGWSAWGTLAAGLTITLLAVLYLEVLRSRAWELNAANQTLNAEIADRKRTESSLHLFQSLINRFDEVIYIVDPASARFQYVNEAACAVLAYDRDTLLGLRAIDVASGGDHAWTMEDWARWVRHLEAQSFRVIEGRLRRSDGSTCPVEVNASLIEEGGQKFIVAIASDITELKQEQARLKTAKEELERLSREDGLTRIANRRHFDEYLAEEWSRASRNGTELSLVIADIDYFKNYNDCYGHLAGDNCLRRIAQAFTGAVERPADMVARFGGEEIAVILPETSPAGAQQVAEKIRQAVQALAIPHCASTVGKNVTVSLGVGTARPREAGEAEQFLLAVDKVLYRAKERGRDRIELLEQAP